MTGSHLRVTLKQKWDLDDDAVIKQLQACKHELAKRKCLLPPAGGPCPGLRRISVGVSAVGGPGSGAFYLLFMPCVPLLLGSVREASDHKAWLGLGQLPDVPMWEGAGALLPPQRHLPTWKAQSP